MVREDERRVASWYDTLSNSYNELYDNEQGPKHDLVLDFFKGRRLGTLVDVGSGPGTFLRRSVHLCDYSIGVDLSYKMLLLAKREKPSSADLVRATSSMLPFRTGSVDAVVSISSLSAGEELQRVVKEIERISTVDSVRAITVLEPQSKVKPVPNLRATSEKNISNREVLYFFGPSLDQQLGTNST